MQHFTIKKKSLSRSSSTVRQPSQKRVRLSPTLMPCASKAVVTREPSTSVVASPTCHSTLSSAEKNAQKLAKLRCNFLSDIVMVIQELKVILTNGPGTASPDASVPPSVMLKLVRTVQTLEKLRTLLLMNPARLQRVSLAQLETVEHQITRNLLPLATLLRSFEDEETSEGVSPVEEITIKMEQSWDRLYDAGSPRSLSGASVAPLPRHDWHFLSMALSLQL